MLLWTKEEDGGTSKDGCCEHVQPFYTHICQPIFSLSSILNNMLHFI